MAKTEEKQPWWMWWKRKWWTILIFAAIVISGFNILFPVNKPQELGLSSLTEKIKNAKVEEIEKVQIVESADGQKFWLRLKMRKGDMVYEASATRDAVEEARKLCEAGQIPYGVAHKSALWSTVLSWLPMIVVLGVLWFIFFRKMIPGGGGPLAGFSKHKARSGSSKKVTFADVEGVDEAKYELREVVEFLRDPSSFSKLGAKIPKGVLLAGLPGTGKTLLARATAGEAGVEFLSISGAEFVEMYVGVGAARVRSLFEEARQKIPCIIFIDEIDAVGKTRGAGIGQTHDEGGQTLNQILAEMDGFEVNEGIIVLAATNRPDVLDPALLRPGRFDRQIEVPMPDVVGREAILKVHTQSKPLAEGVNLKEVACMVPGFSGAQLEQLANEAAILAARQKKEVVEMNDFEVARDKVLMGPERNIVVSDEEKTITAYHEAGHALVGAMMPSGDPIHMVTIIPRGRTMGVTTFLPKDDRRFIAKNWLVARVTTALGGRLAEELVFGPDKITVGAGQDLRVVTDLVRRMVCDWAMGDDLPLRTFGERNDLVFLGRELGRDRDYSEDLAWRIDAAVQKIIDECTEKARDILESNRSKLNKIAAALLEKRTLVRDEVMTIISLPAEPAEPEDVLEDALVEKSSETLLPAPCLQPKKGFLERASTVIVGIIKILKFLKEQTSAAWLWLRPRLRFRRRK